MLVKGATVVMVTNSFKESSSVSCINRHSIDQDNTHNNTHENDNATVAISPCHHNRIAFNRHVCQYALVIIECMVITVTDIVDSLCCAINQ